MPRSRIVAIITVVIIAVCGGSLVAQNARSGGRQQGMVSFARELSHMDAADIRDYVIFRANQSKK